MTSFRQVLLLLSAVLMASAAGCGYPQVSPAAYELGKAIDNMCNARNPSQIPVARQLVAAEVEAGAITPREQRYLEGILDRAEAGDWEKAEQHSRRLLLDQSEW